MELPFRLQFELNRWQRFIPHLFIWSPYLPILGGILLGCGYLTYQGSPGWALLAALFWLWLSRGFFFGLIGVIWRPVQSMSIEVSEEVLRFDGGGGKWVFWLSGLIHIKQFHEGLWTLQHYNGTVLHIPADSITPEQLQHIRSAAEAGMLRKPLSEIGR